MSDDRIAVIDVETTGLSPWRNDRIIEVAIVVILPDGQIQSEYETLINPQRDLGPTHIHRITAADVIRAPKFADVAGDILHILRDVTTVAGHNVSFDRNFIQKEYERAGSVLPEFPVLCTCRLFGRSSLQACCQELGIKVDGMPHRALTDARATARLLTHLYSADQSLVKQYRLGVSDWPSIPPLKIPCVCREQATLAQQEPPRFLQRIAERIHHNIEAELPDVLAYLALLDRVLEDRTIDQDEENILVDAAANWHLSASQIEGAHSQYLQNLAVAALADGVVTEIERRDLHLVSRLLGRDHSGLDTMLTTATKQLAATQRSSSKTPSTTDLSGLRICFTGELLCTLGGEPMTRQLAEMLATQAGLVVASGVTKKLDLLVVADPNTQSSKAKKAREYGIRILSDAVFWRMAGICVD